MRTRRILSALCALLALLFPGADASLVEATYAPSGEELVNPFIGSAAWAEDASARHQPFTLVYANLTWAELEVEEGVFAFAAFEERNHFEQWRALGKHLILRFVLDVPGDAAHRDIPDWVYERTGDGCAYDLAYGRGYCPNYANAELIRLHVLAVEAIAVRYGNDPFLAFVELGSLGHWGEWHVHEDAGRMPEAAVRDQYVRPYLNAFPRAHLMMRRPFAIAAQNAMGLYNDSAAAPEATREWLQWIASGGDYDQTGEADALVPMPDAWKSAPVGGELATSAEPETLLGEGFPATLALFSASHASWIGPGNFVDVERGGALQPRLDALHRTLGYRLLVTEASVREDAGELVIALTWENVGVAPFYFDWTPCLRLTDDAGERRQALEMRLGDVLPGTSLSVEARVEAPSGTCRIDVGILDPATGEPGVLLAMNVERDGKWHRLFTIAPGGQ